MKSILVTRINGKFQWKLTATASYVCYNTSVYKWFFENSIFLNAGRNIISLSLCKCAFTCDIEEINRSETENRQSKIRGSNIIPTRHFEYPAKNRHFQFNLY